MAVSKRFRRFATAQNNSAVNHCPADQAWTERRAIATLARPRMSHSRPVIYAHNLVVPGTQLRVLRTLGYGGGGSVYEVEQQLLGKIFVIKVLHPELVPDGKRRSDVTREARLLAQLEHEHIVKVH